jgi:hypothetical protein
MRKITAAATVLVLALAIGISGCQLLYEMAPEAGSSSDVATPEPASQEPHAQTLNPEPSWVELPTDSGEPIVLPTMEVPPPRN